MGEKTLHLKKSFCSCFSCWAAKVYLSASKIWFASLVPSDAHFQLVSRSPYNIAVIYCLVFIFSLLKKRTNTDFNLASSATHMLMRLLILEVCVNTQVMKSYSFLFCHFHFSFLIHFFLNMFILSSKFV